MLSAEFALPEPGIKHINFVRYNSAVSTMS